MSSERASRVLKGLPTARGTACGPVFLFRDEGSLVVPDYLLPEGNEEGALTSFRKALADSRADVDELIARLGARGGSDDARIFEAHQMLLDDPLLVDACEKAIRTRRLNPAAAVREVCGDFRAQFERMTNPYFRERVRDVEDVERRLLQHLLGIETNLAIDLPEPSVFVADDLSPSDAIRLPAERVLAIVLGGGSPTSHVALLARAMGIPAVTGAGDVFGLLAEGDTLVVNGTTGEIAVNPDRRTLAAARRASLRNSRTRKAEEPGLLRDGPGVLIFANMHPGLPTDGIVASGATGVGLYRSEYLWIDAGREPTEEEQFAAYREAVAFTASLSKEATLTLRTLDIGGDKAVRGLVSDEPNPFLGNRSIRYLLSHPETFRAQLRAILRASAFGRICLLHPMVSCVEELEGAARMLASVKAELDRARVRYDKSMPVGAMIEIPAAALNAAALAKHVDFFSIGTNDLIQYTLAADRGNKSVAALYQPTHPAVLDLVRRTVGAAKANDIPVSVCGETAGDPVLGTLWAAMGVDLLSVSPGYVRPLARVLANLTRADLDAYAAEAAAVDPSLPGPEIYSRFRAWLQARVPDWDKLVI